MTDTALNSSKLSEMNTLSISNADEDTSTVKDCIAEYLLSERCSGIMGVPITFLDKFCPERFEILGMAASAGYKKEIVGLDFLGKKDARPLIGNKNTYARVFIRRKDK